MTEIDLIDNWDSSLQTATFTYDNGEIIGYTYSSDNSFTRTDTPHILDNAAFVGDENSLYWGPNASIAFDQEIEGAILKVSDLEGAESITVRIDGYQVDLNVLLNNGDVTITGSQGTNGSAALNDDGAISYNNQLEIVTIKFNVPLKSINLVGESASPDSHAAIADFFLDSSGPYPSAVAPCFTAGTLIDTDQGLVPVEALKTGDLIRTKDHGFQSVKWVGGSRVHDAPVRIKAGTFGNARDLVVSPRHRMLLQGWQMGLLFNHDEAFATAYDLKNGTTIAQDPEGWIDYYHILLGNHEVIFAEGAATESFFPDEASLNGMAKDTRAELAQTVDLSTFGKTVRPTLTANQAMYVGHNLDMLEDEQTQVAAQ